MATRYYNVIDESEEIILSNDGSVVVVGETWSWTKRVISACVWAKNILSAASWTKQAKAAVTWTKDEITD